MRSSSNIVAAGAQLVDALHTGRSRVRFPMVSLEFFIGIILSVDSASNGNEYQEYFLGGKRGLTTNICGMTKGRRVKKDVARTWETKNAYRFLVRKPKGIRSVGRTRR
jgi:hypothetical protein